jgi:hypothetical protein
MLKLRLQFVQQWPMEGGLLSTRLWIFGFHKMVEKFLSSRTTGDFSRTAQLHEVGADELCLFFFTWLRPWSFFFIFPPLSFRWGEVLWACQLCTKVAEENCPRAPPPIFRDHFSLLPPNLDAATQHHIVIDAVLMLRPSHSWLTQNHWMRNCWKCSWSLFLKTALLASWACTGRCVKVDRSRRRFFNARVKTLNHPRPGGSNVLQYPYSRMIFSRGNTVREGHVRLSWRIWQIPASCWCNTSIWQWPYV